MRNVIKIAIIFLATLVLITLNSPLIGQDQNNNSGSRTQEKNEANPLDTEIKELHKRVNVALKAYYDGQNKEKGKFTLDRGMTNRMGQRDKNVYEEEIYLNLNGGEVSRIELYYTQTNAASLNTETRKIINENLGGDLGDIQVIYESGPRTKTYKVKSILKAEKRNKVKRMYRNYLTRLLKTIEYQIQQRKAAEAYEIDKILELGSENN